MVTHFIPRKNIEIILVLLEIFLAIVLIALIAKDLSAVWDASWKAILILSSIYFGYLFFRIHVAERKLLSLYQKRDEEIITIESEPLPMGIIDGQIRTRELEYQGKISSLERRRKFDLEKIPFLKK